MEFGTKFFHEPRSPPKKTVKTSGNNGAAPKTEEDYFYPALDGSFHINNNINTYIPQMQGGMPIKILICMPPSLHSTFFILTPFPPRGVNDYTARSS